MAHKRTVFGRFDLLKSHLQGNRSVCSPSPALGRYAGTEMKKNNKVKMAIFAVYEPDWKRFIEIMEDSETNYETWTQWREGVEGFKIQCQGDGTETVEIFVDLDEFILWCRKNGYSLNGESRAAFVAEKLRDD